MKKNLIVAMTLIVAWLCASTASAQLLMKKNYEGRQDATYYLKGAVPEQGGKVVFTKVISVPGKSKRDIFFAVGQWAELRYQANTARGEWYEPNAFRNLDYSNVQTADIDEGLITCQGDEEIVFTNKVLNRDATRLQYVLRLQVSDGEVKAEMSQIVYTYTLVEEAERIPAEDWITDREAINKKGRLLKAAARFRVRTIDLKDELFKEIEEAVR
ncbi:MAG: DUF4468 domain-containing protein [Bacteroidales bacterium]|nr:DUF4468 domain-containing protein [Bacteroidales bacterium]